MTRDAGISVNDVHPHLARGEPKHPRLFRRSHFSYARARNTNRNRHGH
jgi:hypothetical protein